MTVPQFPVEGGCQCGAVRYRVNALPLGVYACHCKDCQRASGAGFTLSMIANTSDVELTVGTLLPYDKPADSGRVVRVMRCAVCGVNVWNEPLASPHLRVVKPGTLDDSGWAVPVGNIWTQSALPWVTIDPAVPNFPGQPADRTPLFEAFAAAITR